MFYVPNATPGEGSSGSSGGDFKLEPPTHGGVAGRRSRSARSSPGPSEKSSTLKSNSSADFYNTPPESPTPGFGRVMRDFDPGTSFSASADNMMFSNSPLATDSKPPIPPPRKRRGIQVGST